MIDLHISPRPCPHGFMSNDCPVCGTEKTPRPELPPFQPTFVPPDPDAKTKEMHRRAEEMTDSIGRAVMAAKSAWLDKWVKKLMPSALYVLIKTSKRARHQRKGAQWMAMNQIMVQEWPDRSVLTQEGKPLSEFRWRISDKHQLEFKTSDLTDTPPTA